MQVLIALQGKLESKVQPFLANDAVEPFDSDDDY